MRVRYLCSMAGYNFTRSPGEVVDLPPGEAQRLIVAGYVEHVGRVDGPGGVPGVEEAPGAIQTPEARQEPPRSPETAAAGPTATATAPKPGRRRGK